MLIKIIDKERQVFELSPENQPVLKVSSGDTVIFNTKDAFIDILVEEYCTTATHFQNMQFNPLNGPVYVEDAMPGDTLKIIVEDIEITSEYGTMIVDEGDVYFFDHLIKGCNTKKIKIEDGMGCFLGHRIPLKPCLGVLGVAPAETVPSMWQGTYGGNMDCKLIQKGTQVYLPISVPGALLVTGDVHALQSDGEIVCGLEVPARVTLKVELIKNQAEKWPVLETENRWYVIASENPPELACKEALNNMLEFISERIEIEDIADWIILLTLCGDLEICQIVGHKSTMRYGLDKSVMKGIAF